MRHRCGPLFAFTGLSLLGLIFFGTSFILIWIFSDIIKDCLHERFNLQMSDLKVFLILSLINMVGFLISFVQLLISKPKSKLVLIPIVLFTVTTFAILIALDFYLEIQLTHMTPKEIYTRSKTDPGKKSKSRLKMGYLVIYVCLCFIAGFVYLAFKDFEEYLEAERMANEPNEIIISHIT